MSASLSSRWLLSQTAAAFLLGSCHQKSHAMRTTQSHAHSVHEVPSHPRPLHSCRPPAFTAVAVLQPSAADPLVCWVWLALAASAATFHTSVHRSVIDLPFPGRRCGCECFLHADPHALCIACRHFDAYYWSCFDSGFERICQFRAHTYSCAVKLFYTMFVFFCHKLCPEEQ